MECCGVGSAKTEAERQVEKSFAVIQATGGFGLGRGGSMDNSEP